MAINKVIYGNDTLIDLTSDTVSANNLLAGETAHDRSGTAIQGNVDVLKVAQNKLEVADNWRRVLLSETSNDTNNSGYTYKTNSIVFQNKVIGTESVDGRSILRLGNTTASGSAGNQYGELQICGKNDKNVALIAGTLTGNRFQTLQDDAGTIALTKNIPTDYVNYGEQNFSGSKNLIPYPYVDGSSITTENVTFTNSEEGWIYLNSTLTASNTANYALANPTFIMSKIKGNKYYTFSLERDDDNIYGIVYFSNASGSNVSYEYDAIYDDGTLRTATSTYISLNYNTLHSKVTFKIHSDDDFYVKITLRVGRGTGPFNNKKVRAMLRIGANSDDTWAPWAMTNKQLTDKVSNNKWRYFGQITTSGSVDINLNNDFDEIAVEYYNDQYNVSVFVNIPVPAIPVGTSYKTFCNSYIDNYNETMYVQIGACKDDNEVTIISYGDNKGSIDVYDINIYIR